VAPMPRIIQCYFTIYMQELRRQTGECLDGFLRVKKRNGKENG
jgi:hypothetical protein